MSEERKRITFRYRCDACGMGCDFNYETFIDSAHVFPVDCPVGVTPTNWKQVDPAPEPATVKQEAQHRSYHNDFMDLCLEHDMEYSARGGNLVSLTCGDYSYGVDDWVPHFGVIPLGSKRAYLLAQLCQATHERS